MGAEGRFSGPRAVARREITVKYHLVKGAGRVVCVYVNGVGVPFEVKRRDGGFPLNTGLSAPDADVAAVTFSVQAEEDAEVKFILRSDA